MQQATSALQSAPMAEIPQGAQIALQMSAEPSAEDLQFAQQLGVQYVVLWTDGAHAGYDYYASRRAIFEQAGLTIYGSATGMCIIRMRLC